ncbi:hypothetical protein [Aquisalibacillus elongatus]|uniref:Uncharacterized protein n=1 Tax=Aquisalibacillus elongatus TaxID=485577 RepID=A0A3N5BGW6_9BACI|nr:hypothetical protein [Aquisalibacillus elongatus]RPF57024.1 hypothetical protein EDC24_0072 [Aquisalibacillus elongatus]
MDTAKLIISIIPILIFAIRFFYKVMNITEVDRILIPKNDFDWINIGEEVIITLIIVGSLGVFSFSLSESINYNSSFVYQVLVIILKMIGTTILIASLYSLLPRNEFIKSIIKFSIIIFYVSINTLLATLLFILFSNGYLIYNLIVIALGLCFLYFFFLKFIKFIINYFRLTYNTVNYQLTIITQNLNETLEKLYFKYTYNENYQIFSTSPQKNESTFYVLNIGSNVIYKYKAIYNNFSENYYENNIIVNNFSINQHTHNYFFIGYILVFIIYY